MQKLARTCIRLARPLGFEMELLLLLILDTPENKESFGVYHMLLCFTSAERPKEANVEECHGISGYGRRDGFKPATSLSLSDMRWCDFAQSAKNRTICRGRVQFEQIVRFIIPRMMKLT